MKLCVVCVFISLMCSVYSMTQVEIYQNCMEQEGATKLDIHGVKNLNWPETRTQRCFYACVFEHSGISDGKRFVKEVLLQKGEPHAENEQILKAVRAVAKRCDGVTNDDRCELAADFVECIKGKKPD